MKTTLDKLKFIALTGYVLLLFLGVSPLMADQTQYDQGDLTSQEQYMLELMNRARANPAAEGMRLANNPAPYIQNAFSFYKIDKNVLISDFNGYAAKPPLVINSGLLQIARRHSQYMLNNKIQTHDEANTNDPSFTGADPGIRIDTVFPNPIYWSECAGAAVLNPDYFHAALLVDWGNPDLGHRVAIMGLVDSNGVTADLNQVGIGLVQNEDPDSIRFGYSYYGTEDFVLDDQVFLTGVVYQDTDGDGFYTPGQTNEDAGEGLGGITITTNGGEYFAVTTASGGYAIPINAKANTPITVTAKGGVFGAGITKTVMTTGSNVKVDFITTPPLLPSPMTISVVADNASASAHKKGVFSITRTLNVASPLTLKYGLKGTAVNGVDYAKLSKILDFPAGVATKQIKIKSKIADPSVQKTVTLKIKKNDLNQGGLGSLTIGG